MVKRTRFAEYKDAYANYRFELTDDGILFMQCHTDGGPLHWEWSSHDAMADAFADIAGDREIKVVLHTGTGDTYNASWGRPVTESGQAEPPGRLQASPGQLFLLIFDHDADRPAAAAVHQT